MGDNAVKRAQNFTKILEQQEVELTELQLIFDFYKQAGISDLEAFINADGFTLILDYLEMCK